MRAMLIAPAACASVALLSLASCGDDDVTPPAGNDAGPVMSIDASVRDAGVAPDAGSIVDAAVMLDAPEPPPADGGSCAPEGTPCSLGTACCPGSMCYPSAGTTLTCQAVSHSDDAGLMCGTAGAPCDLAPCCPGLYCVTRGSLMACLDSA